MPHLVPIRRALISVSDKSGLAELGAALVARGVALVSTGGTAQALRDAGLAVEEVAEVTGYPEMMDGRVRTLHPAVHGGLLAVRENPEHIAAMETHGIQPIDLLISNLYPFEATVAKGAGVAETIENIDIGGPAMIRAASKNYDGVTVIVDVEDYDALLAELDANDGATTHGFRQRLAHTAFARTSAYDAAISNWMAATLNTGMPRRRAVAGVLRQEMRYGENPHQAASFYTDGTGGLADAEQVQGKELSYNNINDASAALELVAEFQEAPACAIIKHANPCGVAAGLTPLNAYQRAFDCDRTSAFGGIVALNRPLDGDMARAITEIFTEIVIAPDADDEARALFAKKPNLRLLLTPDLPDPTRDGTVWTQVSGGYLVQDRDAGRLRPADMKIVSKRAPTAQELDDMDVAWTVVKHVKSNAIVYVKDAATVGIGAGQMNRLDSSIIAALKAKRMAEEQSLPQPLTIGSVVASDAFFPFPDGLLAAAKAGATAVIQPGGSVRDDEVIQAADEAGLAMIFTGMRHFRH